MGQIGSFRHRSLHVCSQFHRAHSRFHCTAFVTQSVTEFMIGGSDKIEGHPLFCSRMGGRNVFHDWALSPYVKKRSSVFGWQKAAGIAAHTAQGDHSTIEDDKAG